MKLLTSAMIGTAIIFASATAIVFVGELNAQDTADSGQIYRKDKDGKFVPLINEVDDKTEVNQIEVKEAAFGDRFHVQLIRGAIKAKRAGTITGKQLRQLRVAMISPAFRQQAKELAALQMLSEGADKIPQLEEKAFGDNLADIIAAIDWDKLATFIERLVPLVIKLIDAIVSVVNYEIPASVLPSVDFDLQRQNRAVDVARYRQTVAA